MDDSTTELPPPQSMSDDEKPPSMMNVSYGGDTEEVKNNKSLKPSLEKEACDATSGLEWHGHDKTTMSIPPLEQNNHEATIVGTEANSTLRDLTTELDPSSLSTTFDDPPVPPAEQGIIESMSPPLNMASTDHSEEKRIIKRKLPIEATLLRQKKQRVNDPETVMPSTIGIVVASNTEVSTADLPPAPPVVANEDELKMSEAEEAEEKRVKRKISHEASVNLGLGYGQKKKLYLSAFYGAAWPVLQGAGWTMVKGGGKDESMTHFLPPGVTIGNKASCELQQDTSQELPQSLLNEKNSAPQPSEQELWECTNGGLSNDAEKQRCIGLVSDDKRCMAWRGGKRLNKLYLTKVRDVIERILERKTVEEAAAADAFTLLVPDVSDLFIEQRKDKMKLAEAPVSPSSHTRQRVDLCTWKDDRVHYSIASSRIGSEFQVDTLPTAGSCSPTEAENGDALYERVWDPAIAEKMGKLDFVHTRVNSSKKEAAYDLFHLRGYHLPGFYQEVNALKPNDCSDWTKEDTDRFRSAVFEYHEDMKEISKTIEKPINQCIMYYLVKFKRGKSWKSLKRSMRRKANMSDGVVANGGTLVCTECKMGGMLIACDTCEAHYHLDCAVPPLLEGIPDGAWLCASCRRETRSMLSSQDGMSPLAEDDFGHEDAPEIHTTFRYRERPKKDSVDFIIGATVYVTQGKFKGRSGTLIERGERGWCPVSGIPKRIKINSLALVDDGKIDLVKLRAGPRFMPAVMTPAQVEKARARIGLDDDEEDDDDDGARGINATNTMEESSQESVDGLNNGEGDSAEYESKDDEDKAAAEAVASRNGKVGEGVVAKASGFLANGISHVLFKRIKSTTD